MFVWEEEADFLFGSMRDSTKEEESSCDEYIRSISKSSGFNFWDLIDDAGDDDIQN